MLRRCMRKYGRNLSRSWINFLFVEGTREIGREAGREAVKTAGSATGRGAVRGDSDLFRLSASLGLKGREMEGKSQTSKSAI